MKKVLLSVSVVLMFVIYSLQQRHEASGSVVAPTSLAQDSATTQTPEASTQTDSDSSIPSSMPSQMMNQQTMGMYRDGSYTGDAADAFYGNIQVRAIIKSGKITDVQFLQYPNDRSNSVRINQAAMPYLKQEAIKAQSSKVDIVSGATDSSYAFIKSLASALSQAQ